MLKHKFKSAWTIMLLEEFIADEQRITSPTSYAKASVQFAGAVSRFLFPKSNSSDHERKEEKKEMLFCFELLGHIRFKTIGAHALVILLLSVLPNGLY
jgi:hypothetical protein